MNVKTVIAVVLLLFVAVSIGIVVLRESGDKGSAEAAPAKAERATPVTAAAEAPKHQFAAYYFRTDVRCPSCIKIESWTDKAITDNFAGELEDGTLVWETINTDEKGNEHYVDDYELYTKQVILAEFEKGECVRYKDLAKVWDLLGDQDVFGEYIVSEVERFMAGEEDEEHAPREGLDVGGA